MRKQWLIGLVVLLLLLSLSTVGCVQPPALAAQPRLERLVGSWQVETTVVKQAAAFPSLFTFTDDGIVIADEPPSPFETSGHGNWVATGADTADFTFLALIGSAEGPLASTIKVVGSVNYDSNADTWDGPFIVRVTDAEGAELLLDQGTFQGTRIAIEKTELANQALQPPVPAELVRKIDVSAQSTTTTGMVVDSTGSIYIVDIGQTQRVLKYDNQGRFVLAWGSQGSGEGQFEFRPPSPDAGPDAGFVATDAQGNVYVSDAYNFRVQKFDANGKFLMQFGSQGEGEGQFDPPAAGPIYVDNDGNIYVSSFPRVQKFDPSGKFLAAYGTAGEGDGEFTGAAIGAIDNEGNLYMPDLLNARVQKLDRNGKFLLKWGSKGTGSGQFNMPVSVAIDQANRLYVADNSTRIQLFTTDGEFLGQWTRIEGNLPVGGLMGVMVDQQDNIYLADSATIYVYRPITPTTALSENTETASMPIPDLGESPLHITSATSYGQFNGVDYVKYSGHFVNTSNGEAFDAPFEIVTPAKPDQGNGRLVVEPFHFIEGAGARDKFLTPDLLFGQGFSHAAICWQTPLPDSKDHPCTAFAGKPEQDLSIIADFAKALKTKEGATLVGAVDNLYSIGFSNSADPLQRLLLDPLGQHLFDLSFVVTTGWPLPTVEFAPLPAEMPAALLPEESAERVITLLTEADLILFNAGVLRDDGAHANYRSYEVTGVSHIPGALYERPELDWLPILRALFVAGDRWMTEGVEPPPSVFLAQAAADASDPVYERATGITRDESRNAQGGIRLPDLALGRGQFSAVDTSDFALFGTFTDLQCKPRADGSVRFPDHQTYVEQYTEAAHRLVADGFLLADEADRLIKVADASTVGAPGACP